MTLLELDEIRGLVARYSAAIGPGGEKAWLAGQLAGRVPSLVTEIDRLRALYDDQRRIIEAQDAALAKAEHDHCGCLGTASYHLYQETT